VSDIKKKGLGRGLSALFGDANKNTEIEKVEITKNTALIGDLARNKFQPRFNFDNNKITELSESIKRNGLIQPIAVRISKSNDSKYEIVAGERRWLAAQKAGLHEVPIVLLDLSDNESLEVAIVENIQREGLNSIEEARGYQRLVSEFKYDQDKIAKMMSKSRSHVSNTIRLLSLPDDIISMLEEGLITAGQARPLIGLNNASAVAEEIINKKLSARAVESMAKGNKVIGKTKIALDPNIINEQKKIEDNLGLKVKIVNTKKNSGKISIEYKNLDQFELVSNLLKKIY
jgi:ParB family chromosome partitioning protein